MKAVAGLSAVILSCGALGADVSFRGRIIDVAIDNGGVFNGVGVDEEFSARFQYPDVGGASTINEPDEANYELSGSNELVQGMNNVTGTAIDINIQDNQPADPELAQLINDLVMPNPPAAAGNPVDTWTASGLQFGAFEMDTTPRDGDDEETLFDGVLFEFVLMDIAAGLYDDLSYRALPPTFAEAALRVFVVREADASGTLLYEALGVIDEVDVTFFADGFESAGN